MTVTVDKYRSQTTQVGDTLLDFESLFREHWPRLYGVIYRLVGDHAEAEDLALESFWRLHQKIKKAGKVEALSTGGWLYRVGTNLALNALRAKKRRVQYELDAGKISLEAVPSINPDREAERAEERRQVRQVLAKMRPRSAKILVLRHSGLSYTEIAVALKISPGSVGKILSRAEKDFEARYRALEGS